MNWVDLTIIGVMAIGGLIGFRKGLVKQVIGLFNLIASFTVGYLYMDVVGLWLEAQLGIPQESSLIVGFLLIFFGVLFGLSIIGGFLNSVIRKIPIIGWLNHLAGIGVGLLSTGLFLSLALYLLAMVGFPSSEVISASITYEPIYHLLPHAWEIATSQFPEITDIQERFPTWFN